MRLKLSNAWAFGLGFPQTSFNILCAIWAVCLIWENMLSRVRLPFLVSCQTYVYCPLQCIGSESILLSWTRFSRFPHVTSHSFLHPLVHNLSLFHSFSLCSHFLVLYTSLCSPLSFFSAPFCFFLSPSRMYNVPCLDFNGMWSGEAPCSSITRYPESFLETRQDNSGPGPKWCSVSLWTSWTVFLSSQCNHDEKPFDT